jgi:hypothetical protein
MNPVEYNVLHLLHVAALLVLTGYTFYAFAAPPESRKGVMMVTGIATLIALLTGIRMWQAMFSFSLLGWVVVKAVCWLGLSALTGLAYRKRERAKALMGLAVALIVVAVAMVYLKPF